MRPKMSLTAGNSNVGASRETKRARLDKVQQQQNHRRNSLDALPDEMLLKVLKHLDQTDLSRVARANRRLNSVCKYPSLWTELEIPKENDKGDIDFRGALKVLDRSSKLKNLSIGDRGDASALALYALKYAEKLEELSIGKDHNLHSLLPLIGLEKSPLKKLTVLGAVRPHDFEGCGDCLGQLIEMRFLNSELLDAKTLDEIVKGCSDRLESFEIGCPWSWRTLDHFLQKVCLTIKDLSINCQELSDVDMEDSLSKCQQLETLQLYCAADWHGLGAIPTLSNLRSLELSHAFDVHGEDYIDAFSDGRLKNLTVFLGSNLKIDSFGLKAMVDNCPELSKLTLRNCMKVCDVGLKHLLTKSTKLQCLELGREEEESDGGMMDPLLVTKEAFETIAAPLKELSFSGGFIDALGEDHCREIQRKNPQLIMNAIVGIDVLTF